LWDVADARLELTRSAQMAFFEYYLVERLLELNGANARAVQEFRDSARQRYEANLVTQQDVLQAEVDLADLNRRQVELQRMLTVAVARINTLAHRQPDAPLPPPPARLEAELLPAPPKILRQAALQQRPDLAALGSRIQAEQAALALANKEFYPDFEIMGRYDSFWQPVATSGDLRAQAGVNMNVPIYLEKRRAAVREAAFKLGNKRAEYEQRMDDVNNEVQAAYERVIEMREVVRIYAQQTIPAAEQNVKSARADYTSGKGEFLRLIAGQRQLIALLEKHQESIAEYHVRLADLERAVGGPVPLQSPAEQVQP
jgi:outer membrane protein TolC